MPVIPEVKNVMDELISRVVLSEIYLDTFHPNAHPLYAPLGYQEVSKKRVREANDIFFSNKRSRSDSMDTNYDLDEEKKLEDVISIDDEVVYSDEKDGSFFWTDDTEKYWGSQISCPLHIHPLKNVVSEQEFDLWKEEEVEYFRPFKKFIKSNKYMDEIITIFDDGRIMFTNSYTL